MNKKMNMVSFLKLACDFSARVFVSKELDLKFSVVDLSKAFVRVQEDVLEMASHLNQHDVILISEAYFTRNQRRLLQLPCVIGVQTQNKAIERLVDFIFDNENLDFKSVCWEPGVESLGGNKALFLDRDGVLIEEQNYLSDPSKVKIVSDILPCLTHYQKQGYFLIVVTNQSGIGRGFYTENEMHRVNHRMKDLFAQHQIWFDELLWSPYHSQPASYKGSNGKSLRKPRVGMIKLAQQKFDLNLSQSVLIGDTYTDLLAGFNAGIGKNFLIKHQATDKVGQWQSLQEAIRLDYKQNISISDDQNYFECEGVVFKNITHYQEVYL